MPAFVCQHLPPEKPSVYIVPVHTVLLGTATEARESATAAVLLVTSVARACVTLGIFMAAEKPSVVPLDTV